MRSPGHIIFLVVTFITIHIGKGVRICVTETGEQVCQDMVQDAAARSLSLQCVSGKDRYGCLRKVKDKEADVTWGSAEDVFMARQLYGDEVQVVAEMRTTEQKESLWRYIGVAVVRKDKITSLKDLDGSKSCHTGYKRTAGWNIPISHLLEKNLMDPKCSAPEVTVVEQDLRAASGFFGLACIPGMWAPDNKTDSMLKQRYNNLCTMCASPGRCDDQDDHAGYDGALRCLVDSFGDVAWTKLSAVKEFFKLRSEVSKSDFRLLCPDGRLQNLTSTKPCHWASRPWHVWIARAANENKKSIVSAVNQLVEHATPTPEQAQEGAVKRPWADSVLGVSKPSVVVARNPPVTPHDYLKEHGYDTTIERTASTTCTSPPIRMCVNSRLEQEKCTGLAHALESRRVRPLMTCEMATDNDCFGMVARSEADITSADGGDIYQSHREFGLMPVVSERYGHLDASYFAVAVVKANSGINSFADLKGKGSCHTGMGRTAGWKIPVVTLLEAGLLKADKCNFPVQVGEFFRASCVPGALSPRYDPFHKNPASLCELCVGKEVIGADGPTYSGGSAEGKCERDPIETFYGYTGAFRCLAQGGGDVAFVKHTTVRDNTNGNNNETWAAKLRALDYKLLCPHTGTADVASFSTCHLARVPAHKVMTKVQEGIKKENMRILLLLASEKFPTGQDVFHMFGPYRGVHDLIFKDSATELVNVREDKFHKSLDDRYYKSLESLESCMPKESPLITVHEGVLASSGEIRSTSILLILTLIYHLFAH